MKTFLLVIFTLTPLDQHWEYKTFSTERECQTEAHWEEFTAESNTLVFTDCIEMTPKEEKVIKPPHKPSITITLPFK